MSCARTRATDAHRPDGGEPRGLARGAALAAAGSGPNGAQVSSAIEVEPQGDSNVLAITATTSDPDDSARVANALPKRRSTHAQWPFVVKPRLPSQTYALIPARRRRGGARTARGASARSRGPGIPPSL